MYTANPPPLWICDAFIPGKALRPGESAVAAARVEPEAQVPGKRRWYPPSLKFNAVAPLCRRAPKQPGIYKEP